MMFGEICLLNTFHRGDKYLKGCFMKQTLFCFKGIFRHSGGAYARKYGFVYSVRRQGFLDRLQLGLEESLAHLFVEFRRPACGIASAAG